MSVDKNHSDQFKRYLKGQMSSSEANAFERAAMDDPFAREALEGFEKHPEAMDDISMLQKQIVANKKSSFPLLKIAAAVALLVISFFSIYLFTSSLEGDQLAIEEQPVEELVQSSPVPDTIPSATAKAESTSEQDAMEEEVAEVAEFEKIEEIPEQETLATTEHVEKESATMEIEEPVVAELAEVELAEESTEDDVDVADALQGVVAGALIADTKGDLASDSTDFDDAALAAPLVAMEETDFENSAAEDKVAKRAASKSIATARSAAVVSPTVSGTITDEDGEPLSGVTVMIKGTNSGITSAADGTYALPKTEDLSLIFSYVGFDTQEIEIGDQSIVDVTMGGFVELQEVVVESISGRLANDASSYEAARPAEGSRSFKKYLEDNLVYPEAAKTNEIEGTVVLELTIDESGNVYDIDVKRSLGYGCDQEAIRLVNEGPAWNAAKRDGINAEDKVRVRVRFKLDR